MNCQTIGVIITILRTPELNQRNALLEKGLIHCPDCDTDKPVDDFNRNKKTWSGRESYCRQCKSKRAKTHKRDPEGRKRKMAERAEMLKRGIRQCNTCNQVRPLGDFGKHTTSSDGYRYNCKLCQGKARSASLAKLKEEDPLYRRLQDGRKRSKKLGVPWSWFTTQDLLDHWESQGISPEHDVFTGEPLQADWELDHLVALTDPNSPGHQLGNLVPTNRTINQTKRDRHFVHLLADREAAA